ncbi:2,3-diaminopropionate biosynthesis protein SbnB [Streptomyces sp. CBMA156]|uniref:2,3-diaminopropionate biosynthesis protein SbnB n=1 Tax=Streptomyces sp. CBMA156 TaxID=1930280 RepID=UPI001661B627|nr:2,3-diaminopropionate biosynthesis protein SbnB [Streptomyces sp. CBMA156]MBD0675392.1 2,3-diaminopropionate biosynthesis protein SbnB [Streptomyces sp. CBMA156]MBD0676387.1 2,3-diaminopropionate biosynthesis protein SbnB [Streptomyces sp. CBMA156]
MLILTAREVRQVLDGAEHQVVGAVSRAYRLHAAGRTVLPHSLFLRFPEAARDRIIALPGYLGNAGDAGGPGDEEPVAGIKWISSFPGNLDAGLERASAAIILNSMRTGHPEVLLEGSVVSARRTAASAALAAATLAPREPQTGVTLIGCGVINFEVLTFLRALLPDLAEVTLFDLDPARVRAFAERCAARLPGLRTGTAERIEDALAAHRLVSIATTAAAPHLDTSPCRPGTLLLHLSLRDLTPETVLSSVNIVDDADHVCREATSLHLAEQRAGHRDFIADSIGAVLTDGRRDRDPEALTVFSPFGLGVLDLAVADLVRRRAREQGLGTDVPDFLSPEA